MKGLILSVYWPTVATMGSCEAKGYSYSPRAHQLVDISYLIFCKTFCSGERGMGLVPGGQSSTGMGRVPLLGAGSKPTGVFKVGRDLQALPSSPRLVLKSKELLGGLVPGRGLLLDDVSRGGRCVPGRCTSRVPFVRGFRALCKHEVS